MSAGDIIGAETNGKNLLFPCRHMKSDRNEMQRHKLSPRGKLYLKTDAEGKQKKVSLCDEFCTSSHHRLSNALEFPQIIFRFHFCLLSFSCIQFQCNEVRALPRLPVPRERQTAQWTLLLNFLFFSHRYLFSLLPFYTAAIFHLRTIFLLHKTIFVIQVNLSDWLAVDVAVTLLFVVLSSMSSGWDIGEALKSSSIPLQFIADNSTSSSVPL
jgi:hypothetical protein